MPKVTRFDDYKDSYENFVFDLTDDGILLMRAHTDGGPLVWNAEVHDRMADAFADVAGTREARVVIHTGTGENYNADWGFLAVGSTDDDGGDGPPKPPPGWAPPLEFMAELGWFGRNLLTNYLEIDVPVISVVNGPVNMHSELPLLGNIVLAADHAWFNDGPHFPRGVVPGDGQHIVWQYLLGAVRAHYFLLTNQQLTAQQMLEWGAVNEVLPADQLLDRAYAIAHEIAKRPPLALRYTRHLFTQEIKRRVLDELSHGIGLELLAQRQFYPLGPGQLPMQNAWNSDAPFGE